MHIHAGFNTQQQQQKQQQQEQLELNVGQLQRQQISAQFKPKLVLHFYLGALPARAFPSSPSHCPSPSSP